MNRLGRTNERTADWVKHEDRDKGLCPANQSEQADGRTPSVAQRMETSSEFVSRSDRVDSNRLLVAPQRRSDTHVSHSELPRSHSCACISLIVSLLHSRPFLFSHCYHSPILLVVAPPTVTSFSFASHSIRYISYLAVTFFLSARCCFFSSSLLLLLLLHSSPILERAQHEHEFVEQQ